MSSDDKSYKQMLLIQEMADIATQLGWIVGIPASPNSDEKMVPGLIIGTKQFVADIASVFSGGENIDDMMESYDKEGEVSLKEEAPPQLPNTVKKTTLH